MGKNSMIQYINAEAESYCAALRIVCPSVSPEVALSIFMAGANVGLKATEMYLEGELITRGPAPAL